MSPASATWRSSGGSPTGAQGVIAGCTEIELLVTGDDAGLPWFPTARLRTEAAAELALTDS
jgi:aspartate racemase